MSNNNFKFSVSPEVLELGVKGAYLIIEGMSNKNSDAEFDAYKEEILQRLKSEYSKNNFIKEDSILDGFRKLHTKVGCSNRKFVSSPENMIDNFIRTTRFGQINLVVDIYNCLSLESRLALGAHDIEHIEGNVALRLTNGNEKFLPLGSSETKPVRQGEYGYVDDSNEIICRLEYRQVEKTKVTMESKDCFYIVQGNENTSNELILSTMNNLITLTKKYCGGKETILWTPS